jgi:hypothetical protein
MRGDDGADEVALSRSRDLFIASRQKKQAWDAMPSSNAISKNFTSLTTKQETVAPEYGPR